MDYNEKVNAITRFCVYLSVILIVFTGNLNYLHTVNFTFFILYIFSDQKKHLISTIRK